MKIIKTFAKKVRIDENWNKIILKDIEVTERNKEQLSWYIFYTKEVDITDFEYKLNKVNTQFDRTIKNYIKQYPEMEVQTWAIKLAEAEKVIAWWTSEYLAQLAKDKWVDVEELANKIKIKADEYNAMYSKLEAEKDKKIWELKE